MSKFACLPALRVDFLTKYLHPTRRTSPSAKLPNDPKRVRGWFIYHVNLGIALRENTGTLEHEAHLMYPGGNPKYKSLIEFFVDKLLEK